MEFHVKTPPVETTLVLRFSSSDEAKDLLAELRQWNVHSQSPAMQMLLEAVEFASQGIRAGHSPGWWRDTLDRTNGGLDVAD